MKFRISSILWLTLAVACFFAGMHWGDFYERMRAPRATTATLQVPSKGQTDYYSVTVKPQPIQNFSFFVGFGR